MSTNYVIVDVGTAPRSDELLVTVRTDDGTLRTVVADPEAIEDLIGHIPDDAPPAEGPIVARARQAMRETTFTGSGGAQPAFESFVGEVRAPRPSPELDRALDGARRFDEIARRPGLVSGDPVQGGVWISAEDGLLEHVPVALVLGRGVGTAPPPDAFPPEHRLLRRYVLRRGAMVLPFAIAREVASHFPGSGLLAARDWEPAFDVEPRAFLGGGAYSKRQWLAAEMLMSEAPWERSPSCPGGGLRFLSWDELEEAPYSSSGRPALRRWFTLFAPDVALRRFGGKGLRRGDSGGGGLRDTEQGRAPWRRLAARCRTLRRLPRVRAFGKGRAPGFGSAHVRPARRGRGAGDRRKARRRRAATRPLTANHEATMKGRKAMTQPLTIESDELAWMKSAQSRFARETPIVNLGGLDALSSAARDARFLVAKLESMQRAGSAEFRTALGAAIHVKRVYSTRPPSEFVVASAGAFGLAAAEVGPLVGVPVRIFVPADTPRVIVAELQRSPATVEVVDGDPARCPEVAKTWAARRPGVAYLDPHASPGASVGGALLAQELMAQVRRAWPLRSPKPSERSTTAARARSGSSPVAAPNLVLVSARRCGLAEAVRAYFDDSVSVIAVESEREGTENDSLASSMSRRTAPCGCASAPAGLPDGVERLAVPQIAVWHAQRVLWGGYRILVDRDAALPLAALVGADSYRPVRRARIGLVLCGAPVDPTTALACL